jgi:hypothetical protein
MILQHLLLYGSSHYPISMGKAYRVLRSNEVRALVRFFLDPLGLGWLYAIPVLEI